jgi:hypothetical protein
MNIASEFVFRSVRTLKTIDPAAVRAGIVLVLALAIIIAVAVGVVLQPAASESVTVAPLRWNS